MDKLISLVIAFLFTWKSAINICNNMIFPVKKRNDNLLIYHFRI